MARREQEFLGQAAFGGGMNALDPGERQYQEGINLVIRRNKPETRPGIRRRWRSDNAGVTVGFYFNEDNERYNDADHTGFWFPFQFVVGMWEAIQGVGLFRFPADTEEHIIFASGGGVYKHGAGFVEEIDCTPDLDAAEEVTFCQVNDYVYMFRGEDLCPMRWDGTDTGFVLVPAGAGDDRPYAREGLFHAAGRLWCFRDRDDVYASDVLDPTEWDYTYQLFGIKSGDGDELMKLWPFHDSFILCFKKKSITALAGVNSAVAAGAHFSDYVSALVVDAYTGLVAQRAVVTVGEDVWYLGYGGIYSVSRNAENNLVRGPVALSTPIQTLIDQINWEHVGCAAAALHDNYVIFAVPVGESQVNNLMLVYDLLAPAGPDRVGAWVGSWQSPGRIMSVVDFMHLGLDLVYLDNDGVIRMMFSDSPRDSDEPFADTALYDESTQYRLGDVVQFGVGSIYRAILPTLGNEPTDTDYWEAVEDPQHLYDIQTTLQSRQYSLDMRRPSIRLGRGEVLFRHADPMLTLSILAEDYGTETVLFEDQEYSQVVYDIAGVADWDPVTEADRFHDPHRQDYAVMFTDDGILIGGLGLVFGIMETHNLRFIKRMINDRSFAMRLVNKRGVLRLDAISVPVKERGAAKKKTV